MRLEHRIVDATVFAQFALERFVAGVIAPMEVEMVFVLGDERTLRTAQDFVRVHVLNAVHPELSLDDGHVVALLAFALLGVAFGIVARLVDALLVGVGHFGCVAGGRRAHASKVCTLGGFVRFVAGHH